MVIDFHTHLDWYQDKNQLYEEIEKFSGMIVASSVDLESFEKNKEIAANCNGNLQKIFPTFGVHPEKAEKYENQLEKLDCALIQSKIIGEIGMDFYWAKNVCKSAQEKVFRYILKHCNETEKYCVIHTKGAEKEIAQILLDYPKAKPIIHWYNGPEEVFKFFLKQGYFQTFGCETSRNPYLKHLLKITPENLILAETDNPEAETWLGGKNTSLNLIEKVYGDIAEILDIPVLELENLILKNGKKILGEDISGASVLRNVGMHFFSKLENEEQTL